MNCTDQQSNENVTTLNASLVAGNISGSSAETFATRTPAKTYSKLQAGAGTRSSAGRKPNQRLNPKSSNVQPALSDAQRSQLENLETIIDQNLGSFVPAGKALRQIRDERLYRTKHKTFEEYCQKIWRLSRTHANRLIGAAGVVEVLAPIGAKIDRESTARPFIGLTQDQMIKAYGEAQSLAGEKALTAAHSRQAVEKVCPDKSVQLAKTSMKRSSSAIYRSLHSGFDDLEVAMTFQQYPSAIEILNRLRAELFRFEKAYPKNAKNTLSASATDAPAARIASDMQPLNMLPVESSEPQSESVTI